MKKFKFYMIIGFFALLWLFTLGINPIAKSTLEESDLVTGVLISIEERGGPGDVFIRIKDSSKNYYINRGTERGINVIQTNADALDKVVDIYYARHWSLLDPFDGNKHVTKLVCGGQVLYNKTGQ
ncbi:MAG: hypothetical protein HKN87_09130 [Saprospiraceae bacterium]|nr:hypothetical protein [Saprospiraceae bacterium]